MDELEAIRAHWGRDGLGQRILDALTAAGVRLDALTPDDLAPADQFHGGGKPATLRLARQARLAPGTRVLDVGGGLGGPARTLAAEFGCDVTAVDLTESYVEAARLLTARLGLAGRVRHLVGNALELPFDDGAFDCVWTQNSGMNIADKARLYAGFHRALRRDGRLALQEPMAGPGGPPIFPLMWARDATTSFVRSPAEMREVIEAAGFSVEAWDDITQEAAPMAGAIVPAHGVQRLVMGDALPAIQAAGQKNRDEGRLVAIQAGFVRR